MDAQQINQQEFPETQIFDRLVNVLTNTTYRRTVAQDSRHEGQLAKPNQTINSATNNNKSKEWKRVIEYQSYFSVHPADIITDNLIKQVMFTGDCYIKQIEHLYFWFVSENSTKIVVDHVTAPNIFKIRKLLSSDSNNPNYLYYYHYELKFVPNSFVKSILTNVIRKKSNRPHEKHITFRNFIKFYNSMVFSMIADCVEEGMVSYDNGKAKPTDAYEMMYGLYQKAETKNYIFIRLGSVILKINKMTNVYTYDIKFVVYYYTRLQLKDDDFVISFERSDVNRLAKEMYKKIKIFEPSLCVSRYPNKCWVKKYNNKLYCLALLGQQLFTNNYDVWQVLGGPVEIEFIQTQRPCHSAPSFDKLCMN